MISNHYPSVSRVLAASVLTLAASLPAAAAANDVRTIELVAEEFSFTPSEVTIEPGETVRMKLVNEGRISHNLMIQGDGLEGRTETIQSGNTDSFEITASETGTISFICDVPGHKEAGMTGELVVE